MKIRMFGHNWEMSLKTKEYRVCHNDSYRHGCYLSVFDDTEVDTEVDTEDTEDFGYNLRLQINDNHRVYHVSLRLEEAIVVFLKEFNNYTVAKQYLHQQYYLYTGDYDEEDRVSAVDIPEGTVCELTEPEEEFGCPPPQYLIIANAEGLTPVYLPV